MHLKQLVFAGMTFALTGLAHAGILKGPVTNPANGHHYYLLADSDWISAEAEAITLGGYLATINNQAEQDWVFTQFGTVNGVERSLWIGLHRSRNGGTFGWLNGDAFTFSFWNTASGEPNSADPWENYVHMIRPNAPQHPDGGRVPGHWNDIHGPEFSWADMGPYAGVVEVDQVFQPVLEFHGATRLAGAMRQTGLGIAALSNVVAIAGRSDASAGEGLLAAFALPLAPNATPTWMTNWPGGGGYDDFAAVSVTENGIYGVGRSYTRTTDGVGDKESKGLVARFPLNAPVGGGYRGTVWDRQTPAAPGAFPYGGYEGLLASATGNEDGTTVLYVAGFAQVNGLNNGRLYLSKIREDGSVVWTINDGAETAGNQRSFPGGLVVSGTNIYLAGYNSDSGMNRPHLRKVTSAGAFVWKRTSTNGEAYFAATEQADAIIAVGYASRANGRTDFLIEKWDASGNLLWSRTHDRGTNDFWRGVAVANGAIVAVGDTSGPGSTGVDAVICLVNPANGDLLFTSTYGAVGDDRANAAVAIGRDVYVTGESPGYLGTNQVVFLHYAIPAPPDLAVTGYFTPNPVTFGNNVTLVLGVTNAGAGPASGVRLTDVLPSHLKLLDVQGAQDWQLVSNSIAVCSLNDLPPGGSTLLTLNLRPLCLGHATNRVTVSAAETDARPDDNSLALLLSIDPPYANLARNPAGSGYPHPLESDSGWGGGSFPWEILDGARSYNWWTHGLAFTGGHTDSQNQYSPGYIEAAGVRQATIHFGTNRTFEKVVIWQHGVEHTPTVATLEYWNGSTWVNIPFRRIYGRNLAPGEGSGYSHSDEHYFVPVTGSKVRYSFDNRLRNIFGTWNVHGWLYEFEVLARVGVVPGVEILTPLPGTNLPPSGPQQFIWRSPCPLNTAWSIELLRDGAVVANLSLAAISDSDGLWHANWTVPCDLSPGANYAVRISDSRGGGSGISASFTIGYSLTLEFALTWPDGCASDYVLEEAANIPGPWTIVNVTPTVVSGKRIVILPNEARAKFHRLRRVNS